MTGACFLAAFLILPAAGGGVVLSRRFRWMSPGAAIATAAALGAVVLGAEMFVWSALGVRWNLWLLLLPPAAALAAALYRRPVTGIRLPDEADPLTPLSVLLLVIAAVSLLAVSYAAMTARATSSDLLLFWGTKGEHFGLVGRIDTEYLRRPDRQLLHSDYPPLWPDLYALATLLAGRFAWGASLATLPIFLALSVVAIWSFSRRRIGSLEAAGFAALVASLFGYLLCVNQTAGNADPPLLFFETVALCLLVFAPEEPGAFLLAGMALFGAAWLKLEGIAFGWAVIAAVGLRVRPISWRNFLRLAVPPVLAYVLWVVYCRAQGLLATLGAHHFYWSAARVRTIAAGMTSVAKLDSGYAPWIVAGFLLLVRRPGRRAVFPVLVAALVAAFDGSIYLVPEGDPTLWIGWAAARTLLTPLLALLIAAMAPATRPASLKRAS